MEILEARQVNTRMMQVNIPAPSTKYANDLLNLVCAHDIVSRKLFPNFKEVTESFGCFDAVKRFFPERALNDSDNEVFVVGDGRTPRTGAVFAFRSSWLVHSIDPDLANRDWAIQRLLTYKAKIEDLVFAERVRPLIIFPHAHVDLRQSLSSFPSASKFDIVAMPCCVKAELGQLNPDELYDDFGVWSPCRTIKIWKSAKLETI